MIASRHASPLVAAVGLALAAAVSLGLARFSYALLLPSMRIDLAWSYLTAGAMNTVNAAGYLLGALLMPRLFVRVDARRLLLAGGVGAAILLIGHGLVADDPMLFALRLLTGIASAASFVAGGLLAARLATTSEAGQGALRRSAGVVLGLYYGGTGLGIVASALLVPPLVARSVPHAWQAAWICLGAAAAVATVITARLTRQLSAPRPVDGTARRFRWLPFGFGLAGYACFGLGYIGYMTFIVTLLREQRMGGGTIVVFYTVLGLGVVGSSWLWAGLLQRFRGGQSLALLNGLLALATALPVASARPLAVFASGLLFGSVFLSVVASTTALVRHNLPPQQWSGGIGAFTIVFAAGQIVGPSLVGWIADGPGGLVRGFIVSALLLGAGALLAARQRPVAGDR